MRSQIWLVGLAFLLGASSAPAQEPPCGVSTVKETTELIYPPIARAAHVQGLVILRVEFTKNGEVQHSEVWRGPEMLRARSLEFVNGFKVNPYGGSRTCLISITFRMHDNLPASVADPQVMSAIDRAQGDILHYVMVGKTPPLYVMSDPAGKIIHKRFLGIF